MVDLTDIPVYADSDILVGGTPRRVVVSGNDNGASPLGLPGGARGYTRTADPVRSWTISIRLASETEMRYVRTIWDQSKRGNLPIQATPPWGGSPIPVLIMNRSLDRLFQRSGGVFRLELREYIG